MHMRIYMYIILCKGSETSFVCTCCLTLSSGETLAHVREWLKQLPTNAMETVDCGGQSLDQPQIAAVEKAVLDMKVCLHAPTCRIIQAYIITQCKYACTCTCIYMYIIHCTCTCM